MPEKINIMNPREKQVYTGFLVTVIVLFTLATEAAISRIFSSSSSPTLVCFQSQYDLSAFIEFFIYENRMSA